MTYLNIMNNVLRRLREEEVTSVNDSIFSKMAGDFINDAKTIVEQAADWSALRDTIVISTVADDNLYSLIGCGDDVKVMSAINDTQNCFMEYQTKINSKKCSIQISLYLYTLLQKNQMKFWLILTRNFMK